MSKCPYNGGDPRQQVEPDQPCPVCGDYGDHRAFEEESRCVDTAPLPDLTVENARLKARIAELEAAVST